MYYYSCGIKCRINVEEAKRYRKQCIGNYVDCSLYGGFDPVDRCRQKCVQPRPED